MCYSACMDVEEDTKPEKPQLTAKGQATRQKIVQAAADLICHRGIAGVSIEDIQRAANVGASQLYHYFSSKQELVHSAIDLHTQAILDGQQPFLINLRSFEALQAWGSLLVALQKKGKNPLGLVVTSMVGELSGSDPEARLKVSDGFDRWERQITEGLTTMRAGGILRPEADPQRLGLALMAAIQGGLLLAQARDDTTPLEVAFSTMFQHIRSFAS